MTCYELAVASDLPPKQEQVLHVALHPRHRAIYDRHLARERQRLLGLIDDLDGNRIMEVLGIGPGRGCRTRLETAAGVPQLQAVREAWCAVGESVPIIADGGVKDDKDIFLALVCGASSVMLGSMLSGTDEAPGHVIEDPGSGQKRKIYRGMTSPQAVLEALYDEGAEAMEAGTEITKAQGQPISRSARPR